MGEISCVGNRFCVGRIFRCVSGTFCVGCPFCVSLITHVREHNSFYYPWLLAVGASTLVYESKNLVVDFHLLNMTVKISMRCGKNRSLDLELEEIPKN